MLFTEIRRCEIFHPAAEWRLLHSLLNTNCWSGPACAGLMLVSVPVFAHHGDAGRYEETITSVSGTVVSLQLINPHSKVIFDVEDENGEVVRWQAEVSSVNGLARIGWDKNTLKPGDKITMFGRVVKSGAPYINLSERSRLIRTETCEELYRSGMIFGEPPDYPAPSCAP